MKTIDLITPKCWEMLTDNQLRYVFGLIAQGFTAVEVKTYCLIRWSGMQYNPLRLASIVFLVFVVSLLSGLSF